MSKPKVIFIDSVHPILFELLEEAGYSCEWKNTLKHEEILNILPEYTGAVIRSKFKFDKTVFDAAKNLKWIARSGAGMENIDLEIAKARDIQCYNSPEGNRDAVAEHAVGMLLSLFNHLNRSDREVRKGLWRREENRGIELKGKTVGILGYGYMGQAFAQRLKGFDVKAIAYDKYKNQYSDEYVKEVGKEELFESTDVLSIHLPLTEETTYLIDESYLKRFKKPIYLINTARGKNLRTEALVEGLKSGKVLGACLDVLEYESTSFENLFSDNLPAGFQYLKTSDQVILSPHVAGWTVESYRKLAKVLAEKIIT